MRKFTVCAICFRLKTLAHRTYPAPFPSRKLCLDVKQQIDLRRICLLGGLLTRGMLLITGEDGQQVLQGVAFAQAVQAGHFAPAGELQPVGFPALGHFTAGFSEQLQQLVQISRLVCQGVINGSTKQFPMGGLRLISQPLVVTFSVWLWGSRQWTARSRCRGYRSDAGRLWCCPKSCGTSGHSPN